ncbi:MAG: hypothetical protein ABH951_01910 [Patescibacteria group bacterium]
MEKLKILVIDRTTKENENIVKDVFNVYGHKYDLLVFPPKEESAECLIQAVSFKPQLRHDFSEIFNQHIDYEDEDDDFYDFDLEEIELDTFYDMLTQRFEVETFNLTDVEKK